ncbi:hypothetical protein HPB50_016622 [Hyalomma asiaticum]|uniref:Uncharacterized protein n=1 Tax=Hyalomma asiaticum TaxID=266040 RepID=A0ACB7RNZ4_HYAAI|nr:hypothetical protein HPB50_016622 [Hyalomma asiaticum]
MGDRLPPKKSWLRRSCESLTQPPRISADDPEGPEEESSHEPPEATVGTPSSPDSAVRTPERRRTVDTDVTPPTSSGEASPGSPLEAGCFGAIRHALRSSVIRFCRPFEQMEGETRTPSEPAWASEDTVDYPGSASEKPPELSFARLLQETYKPPVAEEEPSPSGGPSAIDVDRMLMHPPPTIPWFKKLMRRKMSQPRKLTKPASESVVRIPLSLIRAGYVEGEEPLSKQQSSEHHGSTPHSVATSLRAPMEHGSIPRTQQTERIAIRVNTRSGSFEENFRERRSMGDLRTANINVSQGAHRTEPHRGAAFQGIATEGQQGFSRWNITAPQRRARPHQGGSTKETAINLDSPQSPVASETQYGTAAHGTETSTLPAAPASVWVPTKTASAVSATDFAIVLRTECATHEVNFPAASEIQRGPVVHVTEAAASQAAPTPTVSVPTKTAPSTATTDFPAVTHRLFQQ